MKKKEKRKSRSIELQNNISFLEEEANQNCTYYYIIMDQFHVYYSEAIEEILREKNSRVNNLNFKGELWLVSSPLFLSTQNLLPKIKLSQFFKTNMNKIVYSSLNSATGQIEEMYHLTALISSNENVINNAKLRIGSFEDINEIEVNLCPKNPKSIKTGTFTKSDGIWGSLAYSFAEESLLKSDL